MKQLSFINAVSAILTGFVADKMSFSAHDVTRELRRQANTGDVEITDLVRENVDGVANTYRIDHNKVREYVSAEFRSVNGYERDFSRGFTLYRPKTDAYVPNVAVSTPSFSQTNTDRASKIAVYLTRKLNAGETPSLKQIQSRLKGDSVTCAQLGDFVQAFGYKLLSNGNAPSQSLVSK